MNKDQCCNNDCNQWRNCPVREGTHKPAEAVHQIQEPESNHSEIPSSSESPNNCSVAAPAAVAVPESLRAVLIDMIAQGLSGTWHCNRVWEAWHVGTMSQEDFSPVDESDTPTELADAVLAALAATPAAVKRQFTDGTRTLRQDCISAIRDFAGSKPEDGEDWESWFEAAFDLLGSRVNAVFDEHSTPAEKSNSVEFDGIKTAAPNQPLTDAQIKEGRRAVNDDQDDQPDPWAFREGVKFAERMHGIT